MIAVVTLAHACGKRALTLQAAATFQVPAMLPPQGVKVAEQDGALLPQPSSESRRQPRRVVMKKRMKVAAKLAGASASRRARAPLAPSPSSSCHPPVKMLAIRGLAAEAHSSRVTRTQGLDKDESSTNEG